VRDLQIIPLLRESVGAIPTTMHAMVLTTVMLSLKHGGFTLFDHHEMGMNIAEYTYLLYEPPKSSRI
jgi:hypothetical protein